jgi:hypothetical protein
LKESKAEGKRQAYAAAFKLWHKGFLLGESCSPLMHEITQNVLVQARQLHLAWRENQLAKQPFTSF